MTDHERLILIRDICSKLSKYWCYQYNEQMRSWAYDTCVTFIEHALNQDDEFLFYLNNLSTEELGEDDEVDEDELDSSDMGFDPYMGCFTDDC